MVVIYLHQYFNTPEMSGGTRSYEMARRLVAAGHEVHMITSSRDKECRNVDWFTTVESGINVHWLPVPYTNKLTYQERIKAFFRFAFKAMMKAKSIKGDVVFATSTPLTIALPGVFAAKSNKIPMIFEVRDLWPELPIAMGALNNPVAQWCAHKLEKWAYKNSKAVIALSPGMKEGVVRAGYPESNVAVIPNSSDNKEFLYSETDAAKFRAKRPWLGNRPLLVYTGTFGKINGVAYMAELAKALLSINSEIRILLVGSGFDKELVESRASELNVLGNNLFLEDRLPKKEMPALLSAANMSACLFIDMPEMQPNSANKFFDALASGTPVLLNYGGWMHELVQEHDCGLAMWRKPINEVAEDVAKSLDNPSWLKAAGEAARTLAEQEFDRDKLASQFREVINATVENKSHLASSIAPGEYNVKTHL
ncbi:glycosyltransferase family 4 protein [Pseudoalteromonas sp. DL2-H2.2]|uniref:glycosyltransferase family 4 protein n=1 Tax=Pseudoalteromonas sp. DL2-H2.2 TaxID=2908889 RepID=UPI001F415214|nr:glycosyltransferase family 4 protein [Pseudoalteromonas sp. DL2-H2.2]MCF2908847.1 glycosyltransferase family 4 protein [Pseudoalteromonas sp. DL2-H2.2]